MIRQSLRGKAEILLGKSTFNFPHLFPQDRSETKNEIENQNQVADLFNLFLDYALVFTHLELADARASLMAIKVQRAAKAGAISPVDVTLPSEDTRLEPTKTSFFQALGIGTKIIKGSVSLASDVPLLKAGQRVTVSQAALLQMLNIKPFQYGLKVGMVYDNRDISTLLQSPTSMRPTCSSRS